LSAEIAEKQARSIEYQLTIAKLPLAKDIDDFDFTGTRINEALIRNLANGAFLAEQRNAESIAYVDPASGGTSGLHIAQMLEKLGIAAELKSKIRLVAPSTGQSSPRVGEVVEHGEAEIGIQPISELMEVSGVDVVGPLPADLQSADLVYVAGSPATSEQPLPAKALIDFLAEPSAAPVYKANGMEPGIRLTTSG
jgi:molybdate transport system substrate-binding protein